MRAVIATVAAGVVVGVYSIAPAGAAPPASVTPPAKLSPTDIQATFFNGQPFTASTRPSATGSGPSRQRRSGMLLQER